MTTKLKKDETEKLKELHGKALRANERLELAELKAKEATARLQHLRNRILERYNGWGMLFNRDYTEIVKSNGDPTPEG